MQLVCQMFRKGAGVQLGTMPYQKVVRFSQQTALQIVCLFTFNSRVNQRLCFPIPFLHLPLLALSISGCLWNIIVATCDSYRYLDGNIKCRM